MDEVQLNKFQKLHQWLLSQRISFLVYLVAILLLLFGANYKITYITSITLFAFAFLYDTLVFFKNSHDKYWEKFIYLILSVLAYFSYIQAEAMAKFSIYAETGVKAEYFETALAYFKGIYFVPAAVLTSSFALAVIVFVFLILSFVPMLLEILQLDKNMVKSIQKKYLHTFLYLFSAITLVFAFFKDNTMLYESFLGKNYIATGIVKYSFVPNKSCTNIPKDTYIKLLDSNKVLITNMKQLPLLSLSDDQNVTFIIEQCKSTK